MTTAHTTYLVLLSKVC